MDAREYLNRKGVGLDSDPDRPNTLEEKAWERARGSGHQRPKSGTPHDWEDWERHHDDLAEGADTLEQKIDKDAHRKALAKEKEQAEQAQAAVEYFIPPRQVSASSDEETSQSLQKASPHQASGSALEPAALGLAYRALAVLLPPLAVGLTDGGTKRLVISIVLTLLGWVPGVLYAFLWLNKR
ncbi:YqaE/Pmp3 family membrane protein [Vreelandella zhaodongensis]|uniref:YqaE/Pmp3 family membrane protein n=1 Tax=Vreelandella zhaodongensis TaxID=1176240 RepID=A0ABX2SXC7_VREZH|nr:YqaE/Pmp3 family membrane protein [Halomonas zhaodongensis]NYS46486.1 YqaE/Pmp3 family membrane protein [Halomonas zhaodongensis]